MDKIPNFKNRGMDFEKMIEDTNVYYRVKQKAIVYKKPTPIKVLNVSNNKIEGVFDKKSTTDYNGIYNGLYIDFEAKTTKGDIFKLNNIQPHQFLHLQSIEKQNGVAFILVFFKDHKRVFYLPYLLVKQSQKNQMDIKYFETNCIELKIRLNPVIDYLVAIDEWRLNERNNKSN